MVTPTDSLLIDRLLAPIPLSKWWVVAATGLLFLLAPLGLAYVDGVGLAQLADDNRAQFLYVVIIIYLIVAIDLVQRTREGVAQALRPLLQVDDSTFVNLVQRGCRISPISELRALGVGMMLGLAVNILFEPLMPGPYYLQRYAYLSRIVLFGALGWAFHVVFATTRLTNTLLSQPMDIDIFDLVPFAPIGRQSLWLSLSLIGAMLLGLSSANFQERSLWLQYAVVSGLGIILIVVIFFRNTHNVHRALAAEKNRQLDFVDHSLARAYYELRRRMTAGQESLAVSTSINALAVVKQELRMTRTWPYNTEILRTFFISILTPLAVGFSRLIAVVLAGGGF